MSYKTLIFSFLILSLTIQVIFSAPAKKSQPVKCFEYALTETDESVLNDIKARIERKETIPKEYLYNFSFL